MLQTHEIPARTSLLRPPSLTAGWGASQCNAGLSALVRALERETRQVIGGRELRIGIAHTPWQIEQAHALVLRQYRQAGYAPPRLPPGNQPGTSTLLAMHGINPMATMTMQSDSADGLLADQHYASQLEALRARGARLCEFVRFAASQEVPVLTLMGTMLRCAWQIGRNEEAVSDVVIECHPRHASFYRRMLGFRLAGAATTCSRVGAPAVLLHLAVAELERRLESNLNAGMTSASTEASLAGFFTARGLPLPA